MSFKSIALIVLATAIAVVQVPKLFQKKLPPVFDGRVEPGFEQVLEVFRKNVESGEEAGASFAAYYNGKLVAHTWGGYADEEFLLPWKADTLGHYYSGTKYMGAIMIAMLVDRGLLDYDKTVATYWPDFAANGKEGVKVRELVSHQAGLAAVDGKLDVKLLQTDPEKLGRQLAKQKPLWKLGTGSGYHGFTFGLYVDQLIRRVDPKHRSAQQFFADEIAKPFGVDFFVGNQLSEVHRTARQSNKLMTIYRKLSQNPLDQTIKDFTPMPELFMKLIDNFGDNVFDWLAQPEYQTLGIVSINGYGTAEGPAKVAGIIANGGKALDGRVLLSPKAVARLNVAEVSGIDKIVPMMGPITFGPGNTIVEPYVSANFTVVGHYGFGCKSIFSDPVRKVGWAYVTNYKSSISNCIYERRYTDLVKALYAGLDKLEKK